MVPRKKKDCAYMLSLVSLSCLEGEGGGRAVSASSTVFLLPSTAPAELRTDSHRSWLL